MDVQEVLTATGRRTQGLVTRRALAAHGVSDGALSRAVAAGEVARVARRTYALQVLPPLPRHVVTGAGVSPAYVQHVRASLMALGPRAAACGRTAAALRGWPLLVEPARTVEVAVPHGHGRVLHDGVRAVQRRSARSEQVVVLPGTVPLRLVPALDVVLDAAARLPLREAVVLADSALRAGDVTVEQLAAAASDLRGTRAADRVRHVVGLSDPRSGSVLESVHRVQMLLAGISGFETQAVLRALPPLRVDFCFRAARLVVEVDGVRWHQDPARDQARDNAVAALGWRVLRYTWREVLHDGARVLAEVRDALDVALLAA